MNHPIESVIADKQDLVFLTEAPYFMKVKYETCEETGKTVAVIDYDQIDSPRFHPLVDECRGIVIDMETKKVICWPYRRFYNYGECERDEKAFDWNSAVVQSKEDGSLIKVYHFAGKWRIGTRGTAFGNNNITSLTGEEGAITFKDLFLRALCVTEEVFQLTMNRDSSTKVNYFLELCTLENRVVTPYTEDTVFFHGFRHIGIDKDVKPALGNWFGGYMCDFTYRFNEVFQMNSFDHCVETVAQLGGLREGFVLCDQNGTRIKLKSSAYVTAHHIKGEGLTPKRAAKLAWTNEWQEFLSYFPEYTEYIMKYVIHHDRVINGIEVDWENYKHITDQKEFALKIKDKRWSGVLFAIKKTGKSAKDIINDMTENGKINLFCPEN